MDDARVTYWADQSKALELKVDSLRKQLAGMRGERDAMAEIAKGWEQKFENLAEAICSLAETEPQPVREALREAVKAQGFEPWKFGL